MRRRFLNNSDIQYQTNIDNYLTIEALEDGLTASLSTNACEYCVDGDGNWKSLAAGTATESINAGQTLSFRANLSVVTSNGCGTFTISKQCNLKGNCMSILIGDNANDLSITITKEYVFNKLFYNCTNVINVSANFLPATQLGYCWYVYMFQGCTNLITAPELPATTLASSCYNGMFDGCTSLTTAPALPATIIKNNCYYNMFRNCTSLTSAPELPATILTQYCYYRMFYGCKKLNYIKMLATDISASNCLNNWVNGVASTGTFIKDPNMTSLPTGIHGIPSGWTVVNDGEENGSDLTFPINLEAGENGQVGIDLYHYLYDNTGDNNDTYIFKDDEIVYVTGYKVTGAYYTGEFFYFGNHIDSSEYYLSLNLYSDGRLLVLID